jgi:hypothetical protein
VHRIEEVNDALPQLVLEIELLALGNLHTTLDQIGSALVYILQEVRGSRLEQQYLIVVILVMGQVAALLADQFTMQTTVSYIGSSMVGTQIDATPRRPRVLLVRLLVLIWTGNATNANMLTP